MGSQTLVGGLKSCNALAETGKGRSWTWILTGYCLLELADKADLSHLVDSEADYTMIESKHLWDC